MEISEFDIVVVIYSLTFVCTLFDILYPVRGWSPAHQPQTHLLLLVSPLRYC